MRGGGPALPGNTGDPGANRSAAHRVGAPLQNGSVLFAAALRYRGEADPAAAAGGAGLQLRAARMAASCVRGSSSERGGCGSISLIIIDGSVLIRVVLVHTVPGSDQWLMGFIRTGPGSAGPIRSGAELKVYCPLLF